MKIIMNSNKLPYPRLMVAGTHSGVGKTTITLGLMSALKERGMVVQGYKVGPDYIDPSHHTAVTERPSRNLDTWLMNRDVCLELFDHARDGANIAIIEGVMGLYDGCLDGTESGSSAHVAKITNTPVVLILDARGMSRSAGAVVLGYKNFDKDLKINGVIINRIRSERHYASVKKTIEDTCEIPVLGYLPFEDKITLPERHLGLVPSVEQVFAKSTYHEIGKALSGTVDIDKLISLAGSSGVVPPFQRTMFEGITEKFPLRFAVASDEVFNFYYQDNLDLMEAFGVELAYFSPLYDKYVPADVNGIYLGGGFPEMYAGMLAANTTMRESMQKAYKKGAVIYGECGGMMYLLERLIDFKGKSHDMCGILKGVTKMENKRQGLGYITVNAVRDNLLSKTGDTFRAHEFHWSSLQSPDDTMYAYTVAKYGDKKSKYDGIHHNRILASYAHVHFATNTGLLKNLLRYVASTRG